MTTEQKSLLEERAKGDDIMAVVAQDALDHAEYELGYLKDVVNHGCVSGSCSGLIYYRDTHAFWAKHAEECEEVLHEYERETGEAFKFEGKDLRNTLAWMGYEDRALALIEELEAETTNHEHN